MLEVSVLEVLKEGGHTCLFRLVVQKRYSAIEIMHSRVKITWNLVILDLENLEIFFEKS